MRLSEVYSQGQGDKAQPLPAAPGSVGGSRTRLDSGGGLRLADVYGAAGQRASEGPSLTAPAPGGSGGRPDDGAERDEDIGSPAGSAEGPCGGSRPARERDQRTIRLHRTTGNAVTAAGEASAATEQVGGSASEVQEAAAWLRRWLASDQAAPPPFQLRPGVTILDARKAADALLRDLEAWQQPGPGDLFADRKAVAAFAEVRARDVLELCRALQSQRGER